MVGNLPSKISNKYKSKFRGKLCIMPQCNADGKLEGFGHIKHCVKEEYIIKV